MSKNILQDVMPPRRRSIRDIPLNNKKKPNEEDTLVDSKVSIESLDKKGSERFSDFSGPVEGKRSFRKKGGGKMKWWLLVLTLIFVFGFLFSTIFSGAEIIISPKQEKIDFSTNLIATKSGSEGVIYDILILEEEGSREAVNFEEKDVTKKSSGEIVIFNEYDSSPQRLVINTRFEAPDGKIYRIPKSVTVPGRTVDSNGKVIPGSIQVTVSADSPGDEYNIGLVDFTIPGFKGTDRFSKFYAKSKTPMTGGYSGFMKVVDEDEAERLKKEIHIDLSAKLMGEIYSQISEDVVLYSEGIYTTYESKENIDSGDSVQVVEKAILTAVIFDKTALSNSIAENVGTNLGEGGVEILNIEELEFSIFDKEYVDVSKREDFDFSLKGLAHFAAVIEEEEIKKELSGQSRKNINSLLLKYPGIEEAEVVISPFWKRSFPENVEKIEIKRNLEIN